MRLSVGSSLLIVIAGVAFAVAAPARYAKRCILRRTVRRPWRRRLRICPHLGEQDPAPVDADEHDREAPGSRGLGVRRERKTARRLQRQLPLRLEELQLGRYLTTSQASHRPSPESGDGGEQASKGDRTLKDVAV